MTTVFRHETKFCCRLDEIDSVYTWLHSSCEGMNKHYPNRFINNIYFDWFDLQDASDNLIGLGHREKLRLRWYGEVLGDSQKQLERKIRRDRLGTKTILPVGAFTVENLSRSQLNEALIRHASDAQPLQLDLRLRNPVVRNRYLREYYQSRSAKVRLTIDQQQAFYSTDREGDVLCANRIDYPVFVIEIKYAEEDLPEVRSIMNGFPLRPVRHSKYLAGLARVIEQPYF